MSAHQPSDCCSQRLNWAQSGRAGRRYGRSDEGDDVIARSTLLWRKNSLIGRFRPLLWLTQYPVLANNRERGTFERYSP